MLWHKWRKRTQKKKKEIIVKEISMESIFLLQFKFVVGFLFHHCCFWWTTQKFSVFFFFGRKKFIYVYCYFSTIIALSFLIGENVRKTPVKEKTYNNKIQSFCVFFIGNQQWKIGYWMWFYVVVCVFCLLCKVKIRFTLGGGLIFKIYMKKKGYTY